MMLPTGEQFLLADGRQEVVVCEVGGTLRRYDVDGLPVCWGFADDEMSSGGRGQVLAPWPNRLEDGHYVHNGVSGDAALDEPERRNAIHGLVRWVPWTPVARSATAVRLSWMLHPQPAYPFSVRLEVEYALGGGGLLVRTAATNQGSSSAPFGIGFHNYLHAGDGELGVGRLHVPASRHLVSDERLLPRAEEPVAAGRLAPWCGEEPATIGDLALDDCLTGLAVGPDGRWRVRFVPGPGAAGPVTVWAEDRFGWVTVYSGDTLSPSERRRGLAVEPMTCPANALRSGVGLATLAPGETFAVSWGIAPSRLAAGLP